MVLPIMASGVVKSVGRWLVQDVGLSEFQMPMVTGMIFLVPLLLSVWMLLGIPLGPAGPLEYSPVG